jgi:mRNA interferase RelE/StbE
MAYDVCFTEAALKSLQRCSPKDKNLIFKSIEQLAEDPLNKSNVKKLVDFDAAAFRLRVGNYRVLFDREDNLAIIDIIDVLQRKQAYQRR